MHLLAPMVLLIMLLGWQERPTLMFREDWKESPAATPITQDHVANPDLILFRYGPGKDQIKKSHHDQPKDDPYYVWSGECTSNWAIALRHRRLIADLGGGAKIRWRSKQTGFRQLRLILKLADGTWIVSEQADGPSEDWRIRESLIADQRWRALDISTITEGRPVERPDLSRVEEIGFTDLMAGGRTPASSRLDWIEVWVTRK
ncbi:MAG: hypothetical protein ABI882_02660 [Acidobacteriota bacterium]